MNFTNRSYKILPISATFEYEAVRTCANLIDLDKCCKITLDYFSICTKFTCKNRLRNNRERALQTCIPIFAHDSSDFELKISHIRALMQRSCLRWSRIPSLASRAACAEPSSPRDLVGKVVFGKKMETRGSAAEQSCSMEVIARLLEKQIKNQTLHVVVEICTPTKS